MKRWWLGLVVLAACEENPSRLDGAFGSPEAWTQEEKDWMEIDRKAAPVDAHLELLREASAIPPTKFDPAELSRRADLLIAWMDAGGNVPPAPLVSSTVGTDSLDILSSLVIPSRPDDDRLFEAGLYLATQWRRNGVGLADEVRARVLVMKLMKEHPIAPAFADKYAPNDAEVIRTFAAEAGFARRATLESKAARRDAPGDDEYLELMRRFAHAPPTRAAFLAYLAQLVVESNSQWAPYMLKQARGMFAHVDAYQRWLASRQTL